MDRDMINCIHHLYQYGPKTFKQMAYKLMCPGDTYPPMKSFVIEDGKGMNLPDQLYNLIKEVENQLSKLPPNEFLFGFPISDKPRRRKQRRQCFIIGPYRKWFTKVTKIIFKAAMKEGFKCEISRDLRRPGQIIDQVWQGIRRAEVIIADVTPETVKNKVTKENPNVYYELGLSHALGKQTIIISQDLDILPFDVRNMRKIPYNRNNLKQLEKELRLAFREIERRYDYDK